MKNDNALGAVITVVITITMGILLAALLAYMIYPQLPVSQTEYRDCSFVYNVTDLYKTPTGYYMVSDSFAYPEPVSPETFNKLKIGGYVMRSIMDWVPVNVTFVSEQESGYRNACLVTP